MTFDDGPWPGTTAQVLDILRANDVRATFFLVGKNSAQHPDLVRRIRDEGHTVAHHSYSHPAVTLRGLPKVAAQQEVDRGIDEDERAAGWEAGGASQPRVPFFRFPGFADTPELRRELEARNIVIFGADLWASDWTLMTPEAQLRLTMKRLQETGRGIVLFHDTRPQTAMMLQDFLTQLKQQDYRVVHIEPGLGRLETTEAAPGWTSETEASLARIMPRLLGQKVDRSAKPAASAEPLPMPAYQ